MRKKHVVGQITKTQIIAIVCVIIFFAKRVFDIIAKKRKPIKVSIDQKPITATTRKISDNWSIDSSDIRPKYKAPGVYRMEIDTSKVDLENDELKISLLEKWKSTGPLITSDNIIKEELAVLLESEPMEITEPIDWGDE